MKRVNLDQNWTFRRGLLDSVSVLDSDPGEVVNLPHDGMIGTQVKPDAPSKSDSGYFTGDLNSYTKYIDIPLQWADESVGLKIDGAMMNASIDINGCRVGLQHYGYAPFYVDISKVVAFGEKNRITIHTNTSMPGNSRWYTGSGLYRGVMLCHGPRVHVREDGIYIFTKEIADGYAFLEAHTEVANETRQNRLAKIEITIKQEENDSVICKTTRVIQIPPESCETAKMAINIENPLLWDADNPNLYRAVVKVTDLGEYRTRLLADKEPLTDEASEIFGIRTITVDSIRGLRINGKTVKLKGGCVHHDNGLLGAVSLYESEARKVEKLKSVGFNAIRTAHNPPSGALVEACDRLGMYIFDEAFDMWGIAKRGGDYSLYFANDWEKDLTAFVKRDRIHPSVIMWSTGNEIPERGGLNNGYTIATLLAETIHRLDGSRPVSNGICTLWSGLDDELARNQNQNQNAGDSNPVLWEQVTEPFTNGLDVVGYNYMEDRYESDHERFPERVILGSENFAALVGIHWPMVEALPYVIGEFTWTAWDYIGEAGIGKAIYVDKDDPAVARGSWALMPPDGSPYPWRLANDADFDITGRLLPQGAYRSVVWNSTKTYLYSMHPDTVGKTEMITMWGFPALQHTWDYRGLENRDVELVVFSNADEVELRVNSEIVERKPVSMDKPYPASVRFLTKYVPGVVEAISYKNGKEVGRDRMVTSAEPFEIRLTPHKLTLKADGHDALYVAIDVLDSFGNVVTDASIELTAEVEGAAVPAGFGTGNPVTEENYKDMKTVTFRGEAMAILRSGLESGRAKLTVKANGLPSACLEINVTEGKN